MKETCDCGKQAVWVYMPDSTGNSYFCDDCVPRGCSCNHMRFEEETIVVNKGASYILEQLIRHKTKFRIEDSMINGEESSYLSHKYVVELDEEGREQPCCEFWDLRSTAEWKLIAEF